MLKQKYFRRLLVVVDRVRHKYFDFQLLQIYQVGEVYVHFERNVDAQVEFLQGLKVANFSAQLLIDSEGFDFGQIRVVLRTYEAANHIFKAGVLLELELL